MPHIHKDYDFTVTVFIVSPSGRALLVNHPRYEKWLPIGGHVELDEDPEQALFREIKEESGFDDVEILASKPDVASPGVKPLPTPNYMDVHEANPPHKHISFAYFAKSKTEDAVLSDEHNEIKWFTMAELELPQYNLSPSIKFYASEAIKLAVSS